MSSKRYLIRFVNDLVDFRLAEFKSLALLAKLDYRFVEPPSEKPFFVIETNSEINLRKILKRSVLAQSVSELWVSALDYQTFYDDLKSCSHTRDGFYSKCSFSIQVETYGKKIPLTSKVELIEKLNFLPFDGPIMLKNPDVVFNYIEYYGNSDDEVGEHPRQIMFGRWIMEGNRKILSKFSLKKRKFIANTSMEPTLAFLMTNIAMVKPNDLVYDPFVGSGSLLVSAAQNGAYVCGTDIDYLLLHGSAKPSRCGIKERDKDESVLANLWQYNLQNKYLDVLVGDSSLSLFKDCFQFDAIITDPPYGKRESRARVGTTKENCKIPEECLPSHIPSKLRYDLSDIYRDLLNFAAQHLKMNSRLVFWAPYSKANNDHQNEESNSDITKNSRFKFFQDEASMEDMELELKQRFHHKSFKFITWAEQNLTYRYSRILVAMEKIE